MVTYTVKYNFEVYKPSNIHIYNNQKLFSAVIVGDNLEEAKENFKNQFNKNPAYFTFTPNN